MTDALKAIGEWVGSPRKKTIEEPVVKSVYLQLGRNYTPEPSKPVSQWQFRDDSGKSQTRRRPVRTAAADSRRRFVSSDRSAELGDPQSDAAAAWAHAEWKLYDFTDPEQDSWIAAGLRPGQAKIARDLRDAEISPADLDVDVRGWTVKKRLRGGESPREVARLLRQTRSTEAS